MADTPKRLTVGIPRETFPGEARVALVPASLKALNKLNLDLLVEPGAGEAAGFADQKYTDLGGQLARDRNDLFARSDIVVQVRAAGANVEAGQEDVALMRDGQLLIASCDPLSHPEVFPAIASQGAVCFALELMPRITRAQSMDVLSSMATISGYKAVLLAAATLPQIFPMMMTAAGTITPAKVLVVGAGVAGLQAIATSRRLGAVVSGYDVRPAAKEQVLSLGAKFVELKIETAGAAGEGGYAKAMDEDFYRRQREEMQRVVSEHNVVITTAAVPGKEAPKLITAAMVEAMPPGGVIVDLAAERGGNCELTRPGETIVEHGVTIIGPVNLASTIPTHASEMYARNVVTFLGELIKQGEITLNMDDEVIRETLITRDGQVVNPRVNDLLPSESNTSGN